MKVSKEIAAKVEKYTELRTEADKLYQEIREYFEDISETNADGFDTPFITDKPQGIRQTADGEFCDQIILGEDWYKGKYYYPTEEPEKYVGFSYEI